jgi:hypothetical protein
MTTRGTKITGWNDLETVTGNIIIPVAGMRAFVSDCNIAPTGNFGVTISNGGSYTTSVWSNGSSWMIG